MAGLPYDRTPTPEPAPQPEPSSSTQNGPAGLDMALDDYIAQPPAISDRARDLMGRMGKGKVYLLEESTAIVNVDGKERIRGDPRIAALAEQLDLHDPSEWLFATSAGSESPIRPSALFVRSDLIKHLSTAKLFTWATGLGADPMGIEWLNDETLLIVFRNPGAALLALSLLSKAGFDPAEGDDPLLERSAHSFPISLLPQAPLDPADSKAGTELLSDKEPTDGPRRRGRGTFAGEHSQSSDLPSLVSDDAKAAWNLAEGIDPNTRIAIRYAVESDVALRKEAKLSEWYKRHGRQAGKERSSAPRGYGRERESEDLSWSGRGEGEGDDFRKRIGRERRGPYSRPPPREDRRGGRKTVDDLDQELERMAQRRAGGENGNGMDIDMDMDMDMDRPERRERRSRRPERRGKDDLEKELEDMFAARSAAPA